MIETEIETDNFSFIGGAVCLDFTNTVSNFSQDRSNERLHRYPDLVAWASRASLVTSDEAQDLLNQAERRPAEAETVLGRALALREAIHQVFEEVASGLQPGAAGVAALNAELREAMCHSRIVPTAHGFDWDWAGGDNTLDRVLWPVARSAADLLTSDAKARVRECGGDDCEWLFLDTSRNHSRHWCDMRDCGNRAKARRHYHRTRGA